MTDTNLIEQLDSATAELDEHIEDVPPQITGAFSDEDTAELISLWESHLTVREIANQMNRPYNNVRNKVAQLQSKGIIRTRDPKAKLPDGFIQHTAGAFNLPVDVVQYLTSLVTGSADKVVSDTVDLCAAYTGQNGYCFYLRDRVKLTTDKQPSGMVVCDVNGRNVLVCRAVAQMRMVMSHTGFINVCKHIANNVS